MPIDYIPAADEEIKMIYFNMDTGTRVTGRNAREALAYYTAKKGQMSSVMCKEGIVIAASLRKFSLEVLRDVVVNVLGMTPIADNKDQI